MENLLKRDKSPYLREYENNPFHWQAWNEDILQKAKLKNKQIFLSVRCVTCHWYHITAHESFENQETANIMNKKFINIKIDREMKLDLDYVFQKSLSILTGMQRDWSSSMFLDKNGIN